jgi:hypothetical protein
MGVAGFVIGTFAGHISGRWVYRQVRTEGAGSNMHETRAAVASGLGTAVIASAIYILLGVHTWAGGMPWGFSVFLGLCMGIFQGALYRGKPLLPPRRSTGTR